MADFKDRFFVKQEHNLIIPINEVREMLAILKLPVYNSEKIGEYKCHFSHVMKRLTFIAFQKKDNNFDPYGIESHHLLNLKQKWETIYTPLVKQKHIPQMDSGRMFCGLYISQQIKKIVSAKKFNDKDIAYNWKAKEMKDIAK